jgi:hypothetical protein
MERRKTTLSLLLATTVLAGCGTTERDWKLAKDANTASGYVDFLAKHPHGSHVDEARAAIEELDWNSAKTKNKIDDYNRYLLTHSAGKHAFEAKAAIEAIDAVTYVPLDLPCGARITNMAYTFFGTPSGELMDFECLDKDGKIHSIELNSKEFKDGKIETKDFGIIRMRRPTMNEVAAGRGGNALSVVYEMTTTQVKKLRPLLGFSGNAAQASAQPAAALTKK